jgi:putative exosortase-associated protein (TIGR04073 family)
LGNIESQPVENRRGQKMMKQMKRWLALVAILGLGVAPAIAQGQPLHDARPRPERGMGYKFGRGAVNVLTFWTEIPRNVAIEWQRTDPASGFFLGVGKGIGYGYARFMGGLFDMVTFPFPVPMGFAPVMDPEFAVENPNRDAPGHQPYIVEVLTMEEYHAHAHTEAWDYSATPSRQWP